MLFRSGKASGDALKAGFGAFAGFLLSVVLKVTLCGYFIYSFVRALVINGTKVLKHVLTHKPDTPVMEL